MSFIDQNGVTCFVDQNGVTCFVDQNGIELCCAASTYTLGLQVGSFSLAGIASILTRTIFSAAVHFRLRKP